RTRNLAIGMGTGTYIAVLTQDAMPAHDHWLFDLVSVLEHYPDAAGAFGPHFAYPAHSQFNKLEMQTHFDGFLQFPLAVGMDTDRGKWDSGDPGWRGMIHFYSDNNSCMRRSVWEQIPYPEVSFGEDQMWANEVVEAGYLKAFAPSAHVFHSHEFSEEEMFKRMKSEAAFFMQEMGKAMGPTNEAQLERALLEGAMGIETTGRQYGFSRPEIEQRKALEVAKIKGIYEALRS
ncbi:MAG: glycosyltransferase family 2 protein, partial [Pseudomonadota bacterium]